MNMSMRDPSGRVTPVMASFDIDFLPSVGQQVVQHAHADRDSR